MKPFRILPSTLLIAGGLLLPFELSAAASASDSGAATEDPAQASTEDPAEVPAETAAGLPGEAVATDPADTPAPHWSGLPIWGVEAQERGYAIPLPFGIGLTAYSAEQPVDIDDLQLGRDPNPPVSVQDVLQIDRVETTQQNTSIKLDVLVLPFLDVYALAGYTTGTTKGLVEVAGVPLLGIPDGTQLPLDASFGGPTYGLGVTLQGGMRVNEDWHDLTAIAVVDWNRTRTDLEFDNDALVAQTKPEATVFSARVGLHGTFGADKAAAVWIGAMHQDIQHVVSGAVADTDIRFVVVQKPTRPWNTLVGGLIEYGRHGYVLVEGGFGVRDSVLVSAVYRF